MDNTLTLSTPAPACNAPDTCGQAFSNLTNDELLRRLYAQMRTQPLVMELAKRLEQADERIEELAEEIDALQSIDS